MKRLLLSLIAFSCIPLSMYFYHTDKTDLSSVLVLICGVYFALHGEIEDKK